MKTTIISILLLAGLSMSCSKSEVLPDAPILGLGGETWVAGPIDKWLETNFVSPYNIEVKYKWDPFELNYLRNLVPVKEDKVELVMTAVRDIWIAPYVKSAGEDFIKKYSPKVFMLAGSAEHNNDGTIVLGQAEGGRKIVLMVVNKFAKESPDQVVQMLHTIHHEFAHILHQNRLYPVEWKSLNPQHYTAAWFNSTDQLAQSQGLVTAYAKASPDEDFVETVSVLLVYGQQAFDTVANNPNLPVEARNILRKKEDIVVRYFQREYGINFRTLQADTQKAIQEFIK
ncbi:MAG: putative zinc-binding metallopeptidase [Sphingobacterium sp.]|nr:putative zinc-binding metallopeptidase [Sphingobacterium sp.]